MQKFRGTGLLLPAALFGGLCAFGPAFAQTDPIDLAKMTSVREELHQARGQEADLVTAINAIVESAKPLVEAHKSHVEQAKALLPEGESLRTALNAQHDEAEKQRAATAAHNKSCPHKTSDKALLAKCNAEIARLGEWAKRIKTQTEQLEPAKIKYNKELQDSQQSDQQTLAQLAELKAKGADERKQLETLRARIAALHATWAAGKARCVELQKLPVDPKNAEALGYCRAMAEDGSANPQAPAAEQH